MQKTAIEDIVKATLDRFAESYKMSTKKEQYANTDEEAKKFIMAVIPSQYLNFLSYYDFKKQQ